MSDQPRWVSELTESSSNRYQFQSCLSLEELQQVTSEQPPDGVIADLSRVSGGGHMQEQQLGHFRQHHADLPIAMLTDDRCPEPLERRALYSSMLHLKGAVTVETVIDWIRKTVPAEDKVEDLASMSEGISLLSEPFLEKSVKEEKEPGRVLSGINRRFETLPRA